MTAFFSPQHKETVSDELHSANWTQKEFAHLLNLWNAGYVTSKCAMVLKKTDSAVSAKLRWARKNGFEVREHERKPPNRRFISSTNIPHTEDFDFFSEDLSQIMREGFK